ncbi:MAG: UDP-N-acetylmuramoyl-L-alanine--D-glutamate ligase [Chitinivibrionales bacterium]|nr:UDP-N-acetylmuramoyl-L-alanine--D-glutamate ligase [Chitinivibrionales bacterium]MBD3394818.1 UDP-N-acetylmuramoyl-L-alanine--D-glutamate ligase [Chitinivibrionales bacterium]
MNKQVPKEYMPKQVSILGAARSGLAAARVLLDQGVDVFLSDACDVRALDFTLASNSLAHLRHEAGEHTDKVLQCDAIVTSPGIRSDAPILQRARKAKIPVWSEMELGFRLSRAPFLAVTGSTGKSTTVSLLGAILEAAGKEHVVAGNIGVPVSSMVSSVGPDGFVVAEVSSFQLENIDAFKPKAAAVLNLLKNHLDRYDNEEGYYDAKKAIARNMDTGDCLVLNACDERLREWSLTVQDRTAIVFFGREMGDVDCVWHADGIMYRRHEGAVEKMFDLSDMKLRGGHNRDNAAAAAALAASVGIDTASIARGITGFAGLPHRLEFVREIDGVSYYNDSKATTAESVACAAASFGANVHLICGGRDKGCDFAGIGDVITEHVKTIAVIGEAAERIAREWAGITTLTREDSLEAALLRARGTAAAGDVVLLSPGCSSFDMFSSYIERGDVFKKLVNALAGTGGGET